MRALVPRISKSYYYPAMAKRLGQEGRVLVALRVDARGELVDVKVHRSSGHAILDKAAVDALRREVEAAAAAPAEAQHRVRNAVGKSLYQQGTDARRKGAKR